MRTGLGPVSRWNLLPNEPWMERSAFGEWVKVSDVCAALSIAERLREAVDNRFSLLTDCTPLDATAAIVLNARIDELRNVLAVIGAVGEEPKS